MSTIVVGHCQKCGAPNYGSKFCESCGAQYIPPAIVPAPPYGVVAPLSGVAVASLVFGILGGTLLAIILGHVALSQIRRTGDRGHGLAIGGLVLGYVGLVSGIIALIVFFSLAASGASYSGGF